MKPAHLICIKPISWLHILGTFQAAAAAAMSFHPQRFFSISCEICCLTFTSDLQDQHPLSICSHLLTTSKQEPASPRVAAGGQHSDPHYTRDNEKRSCRHFHSKLGGKLTSSLHIQGNVALCSQLHQSFSLSVFLMDSSRRVYLCSDGKET